MASNHKGKVSKSSKSNLQAGDGEESSRRLFVMRHGERCDFSFGRSWIKRCFDDQGNYTQMDLNLPPTMVQRDSHLDFAKDSPLTEIGKFQARATGEALKRAGVSIKHVYSSPALRCIQTAQNVIDGMGNNAKIRIETSAFEWFGWYKGAMPHWISPQTLVENGFNVDTQHKPFATLKTLNLDETVQEYYNRGYNLAQHVLKQHADDGEDILIVAHAGSLDTFTRSLRGKPPLSSQEMHQILASFTYCCICCLGQGAKSGKWTLQQPPIPPLHEFDWKVLL